ncbi:MAG: methionyl-tRNA formyltransferase [Candidatus Falkowbacteria bacterium]
MKNKIKTIFIGTPDFGIPCLRSLIEDELFDVVCVITQPDKKTGRKQILTPPPIKVEAQKYKIPIMQPQKISDISRDCHGALPLATTDLIVVVAYSQLIPEKILNMPKYGCINVHGSLLPKYRGASVIAAPILNGDKYTGATIMKMDKGLDTGPILAQNKIEIKPNDTAGTVYEKLSKSSAPLLIDTLEKYISGKIKPKPQDNSKSNYCKIITKKDGKIDWEKPADFLERFVRAMSPWPSAHTKWNEKKIKIIETEHETIKINSYKTGEIFLHDEKLAAQCGKDALIIKKLQLEGKKEMKAEEFLRGYKNFIGSILE